MGLSNTASIDLIALEPDKTRVVLIIVDSGEIVDVVAREEALKTKLLNYLHFVASGEFGEKYPNHADLGVFIRIICFVPPTKAMHEIRGIRDHDHHETFLPVVLEVRDAPKNEVQIKPHSKTWWQIWK